MTITHPFNPSAFQNTPAFQTELSPYIYPNDLIHLSIMIGGVEVVGYLDLETDQPEIVTILNQYPSAKFVLYDVPASIEIKSWQEVIIYDNSTKIFAGLIMIAKGTESDLTYGINYEITCTGYAKLLETVLVTADKYDYKTDAYVIHDLFEKNLPEIDSERYVFTLKIFDEIPFGRKTLKDALDYICKITGASWYVDYDKRLHYFGLEVITASFGFSQTPDLVTTFPFYNFQKTDNGNKTYNVIEIVGGFYLSVDETVYLAGNGASNRIILPFKYHAPVGDTKIQVWRNDGTQASPVWTALGVKVGYIETLTGPNEILFYFEEKVIEEQDAFPNFTNAVKLTGRYEAKLRVRVDDQAAISEIGREIEYPYFDDSIIDKTVARTMATALLSENSGGSITYTWDCEKRGMIAGIIVSVNNSTFSVNESLLIQKTITRINIGGHIITNVEVGKYNRNLVDTLIALRKMAKKETSYFEDGLLDVTLNCTETCVPTESTTLTAS